MPFGGIFGMGFIGIFALGAGFFAAMGVGVREYYFFDLDGLFVDIPAINPLRIIPEVTVADLESLTSTYLS